MLSMYFSHYIINYTIIESDKSNKIIFILFWYHNSKSLRKRVWEEFKSSFLWYWEKGWKFYCLNFIKHIFSQVLFSQRIRKILQVKKFNKKISTPRLVFQCENKKGCTYMKNLQLHPRMSFYKLLALSLFTLDHQLFVQICNRFPGLENNF